MKDGDRCRGQPERYIFISYDTEVSVRVLLLFLACSILLLIRALYYWVLGKGALSTIPISLIWLSQGLNPSLQLANNLSPGQIISSDRLIVVSQLFCVARHVGRFRLGSKSTKLYVRLSIIPLNQLATYVSLGIIR